uniref:Unannotated protein n=1 Tax=freshwater metagenome TaxID=449393 RepID=A0A6J5ZQ13_9ZZZZ
MRILAIGQLEFAPVAGDDRLRGAAFPGGKPVADRGVVAGDQLEGLGGKTAARLQRQAAVRSFQLGADRVVLRGVRDDGGKVGVLRCGANHRWAADVDLLDHLGVADSFGRDGLFERVKVHADEVDKLNAVLFGLGQVLAVVAEREQPGVEPRVERLDAAVHDLGETGEIVDRANLKPGAAQRRCRSPGRDQFHPERRKPLRELNDAALVRDRQQRAADAHCACGYWGEIFRVDGYQPRLPQLSGR